MASNQPTTETKSNDSEVMPPIHGVHDGIDITDLIVNCAANNLTWTTPFVTNNLQDENQSEDTFSSGADHGMHSETNNNDNNTDNNTDAASELFSLQDAMAASQLMDRTMDCCEVPANLIAPWHNATHDAERMIFPRPIPDSLEDPLSPLPWHDLTIPRATVVCLELLVRLQSLTSGSAVGESTFTCLYAHSTVLSDMALRLLSDPKTTGNVDRTIFEDASSTLNGHLQKNLSLDEDVSMTCDTNQDRNECAETLAAQWSIFACTLALIELTECIRGIILNADIYEEEDFVANTHHLSFFSMRNSKATIPTVPGNEPNAAIENIMDAKGAISRALLHLSGAPMSNHLTALKLILSYKLDFLSICSIFVRLSRVDLLNVVTAAQETIRGSNEKLGELLANIDSIIDGVDNGYSYETQCFLHRCFDSFVNRPLVGNLPIRKISFQKPSLAISTLRRFMSEMDDHTCCLFLQGSSLPRIRRILDRATTANILTRSMILLNLYFDDKLLGQFAMCDLLAQDLLHTQLPIQAVSTTMLSSHEAVSFLNRLAKPIYDTLKLKLLNRNRQRAYIDAIMLSDWVSLQNEVVNNGTGDRISTLFSRCVLSMLLQLMDRYVAAGLEVGLFVNNHHDLTFAFWYRDFLLSALNQNISAMRQMREIEATANSPIANVPPSPAPPINSKLKGKKKHQKNKAVAANDKNIVATDVGRRSLSLEELEDDLAQKLLAAKRNMCRKTVQFLAALTQAGILKEKKFEFTSMEKIFDKRFDIFGGIQQPPPLTYQDFVDGNDFSNVPQNELLQTISEGFRLCRTFFDQILQDANYKPAMDSLYAPVSESELRALMKVCLGNSVYVQKLRQMIDNGDFASAKTVIDFSSHDQFCILKVSM